MICQLIGFTEDGSNVFLKSLQNNNPHRGKGGMSCQVSRKGIGGLLGWFLSLFGEISQPSAERRGILGNGVGWSELLNLSHTTAFERSLRHHPPRRIGCKKNTIFPHFPKPIKKASKGHNPSKPLIIIWRA